MLRYRSVTVFRDWYPLSTLKTAFHLRHMATIGETHHDQNEGLHNAKSRERKVFDVADLTSRDPFKLFKHWLEEAFQLKGIEANCMALTTATKDGMPSVRVMLMKSFSKQGFIFFTNYESRKAKEMEENPYCNLVFNWQQLKKSVTIDGSVTRIPVEESEKYFHSRPRESQIGALVSHQSRVIPSREFIDKTDEEMAQKYSDEQAPVPRPEYWGGYCVTPSSFEFWYRHPNGLHDRLRFRRPQNGEIIDKQLTMEAEDGWLLERFLP